MNNKIYTPTSLTWRSEQATLTRTYLLFIKPQSKRRASATYIMRTTYHAVKQLYNIRRITVKQEIDFIFLTSIMGIQQITIRHKAEL